MRHFLAIFVITIIAYADAYFSVSQANKIEEKFMSSFLDSTYKVYLISLGEFGEFNSDEA